MGLSTEEFFGALYILVERDPERRWPYEVTPGFAFDGLLFSAARSGLDPTQAWWDGYGYNPPVYGLERYPDPDISPDVRPKPSWSEIVDAAKHHRVLQKKLKAGWALENTEKIKEGLSDSAALALPDRSACIGQGLSRMAGLSRLLAAADAAGWNLPHVVMRGDDQKHLLIHSTKPLREIVDAAAARENVVESSHNIIMERYHAQAAIRDDESRPVEEREMAADDAFGIVENYKAHLEGEMAVYDPDALPSDLPTLKTVLTERLEATATGHQKALKGALTQQAIDNWDACVDQARALQEIAKQCTLGSIRIGRADDEYWRRTGTTWAKIDGALPESFDHEGDDPPDATIGADGDTYRQTVGIARAEAAFDRAKAAVEAVTPANVPVWHEAAAQPIPIAPGTVHQVAGVRTVTLCPTQPPAATDLDADDIQIYTDGPVAIDDAGDELENALAGFRARRSTTKAGEPFELVFWMGDGVTHPVTFIGYARNLCGPSKVMVRLTPPSGTP